MFHRVLSCRATRILVAVPWLFALPLAATRSRAGQPPPAGATPAQVEQAIEKGKAFLYSRRDPRTHNWEEAPQPDPRGDGPDVKGRQWGGLSAIAVYALLASGENPQTAKLAPSIEWLRAAPIVGNYALGLRCQVYPFLPQTRTTLPGIRKDAQRDVQLLLTGIHRPPLRPHGKVEEQEQARLRAGLYAYWVDPKSGPGDDWYDLSVSQYAVLGIWACAQVGADVPADYWKLIDAAWKRVQEDRGDHAGAWRYRMDAPDEHSSFNNMTAAGVATLFISQDYLLRMSDWSRLRGGVTDPHIDAGLAYMDQHVGEVLNGEGNWSYYGMYGVERIGVAGGRKYFGTTDWYRVGAEYLVKHQKKDGSWGGLPDTCFALLFLTRGRAPVAVNKLQYDLPNPRQAASRKPAPAGAATNAEAGGNRPNGWNGWDERPRDVANFTRWAGEQVERFLNWQVVNLDVSPDDLHDAPILYVSGSNPLDFDDATVAKLREFVESGGMILANADGGSDKFTRSITGPGGLGAKLFPKYAFRILPENHVIYTDQQFPRAKSKSKPQVLGMSNGVRELFLLVPEADPARAWQTGPEKLRLELFQLGQDIFLYAVDKSNLRYRGETYLVAPDPRVQTTATVKVARLDVGGNPDPEPGGWRRLAAILHNQDRLEADVQTVKLAPGALAAKTGITLAHLTGTTAFTLTAAQRVELKQFVARGGTLVVDAAGGSNDFAAAAEAELAAMFGTDPASPGAVGKVLPPTHALYTWAGAAVERFEYRNFARSKLTGHLNVPRVRGIAPGGLAGKGSRVGVFYSREDLSGGLVGEPVDGVLGYTPETATAIMRNMVLYAAAGGKPPATQPATHPATKLAISPATAPAAEALPDGVRRLGR